MQNTGSNSSGSWNFQDTLQLHLYTNLKNLRLQKISELKLKILD
jgi:hypothetical protein